MIMKLIGMSVFIAATCVIIIVAGGGMAFLHQPVVVVYLVLWVVWWLMTALGRRRGLPSTYDRKQRIFMVLGVAVLPFLIFAPPWEYAHFAGPIPRDGALAWVGLALFASGITLQSAAMWAIRGFYTVRLSVKPGHQLVTNGPYRLVRHPGYLSYLFSIAGIGLALSSLVALGLTVWVALLLRWRIEREEEMLLAEFGEEYRTYMKKTKWRLFPLVY